MFDVYQSIMYWKASRSLFYIWTCWIVGVSKTTWGTVSPLDTPAVALYTRTSDMVTMVLEEEIHPDSEGGLVGVTVEMEEVVVEMEEEEGEVMEDVKYIYTVSPTQMRYL